MPTKRLLATPPPDGESITVRVPTAAHEVAALQRGAESDAAAIATVPVDDDEGYSFADALLTDVVQRKDAALAMRRTATGPMYEAIRVVESWFKPLVDALGGAERTLKGRMGEYRVLVARREADAREAAAVAAESGDAEALIGALEVASAGVPDGRATVALRWTVKRILPDMLPDEWWTPNVVALEALAAADKSDDGPVVPGVVFEMAAKIGARR